MVSGILAGIGQDLEELAEAEQNASAVDYQRQWKYYQEFLTKYDSENYSLHIATKDGNQLSSSNDPLIGKDIIQQAITSAKRTGQINIPDHHFVWSKQTIDNKETQLVIVFETTASRGSIFASIGTPTIVSGLVLLWITIWAALILASYTSKQLLDPIILLPTRNLFRSQADKAIAKALKHKSTLAICVLDINHFEDINNTLGYELGNKVLRVIAGRIKSILRSTDQVGTLGGDKFALLISGLGKDHTEGCAQRTLDAIKKPVSISGIEVEIDSSIGFGFYPADGSTADILIQRAEVAMLHAKNTGNDWFVYAPEADPHSLSKLALLGELRQALEGNHLELYFQPKVDLTTKRVCGVESLLRWNHADMGFIPPDEFIPLAENSGLINPLTRWVLENSLNRCSSSLSAWPELTVSVNLSTRNLHDESLPVFIGNLLEEKSIPPQRLQLEITETALMLDANRSLQVINQLRDMGISISLDDYGTGYTSLALLKGLPLQEIKIDRSFVKDIVYNKHDQAIVRTTIDLARNLGITIVAEGVETRECLELLKSMGCSIAQGYHISRPLINQDMIEWIQTSPWGLPSDVIPLTMKKPKAG